MYPQSDFVGLGASLYFEKHLFIQGVRVVALNSSEQLKLDIISKLKLKKITKKQACLILNVSERTIERYLEKYNEKGVRFTIHGNKNKVPKNKTSNKLKVEVVNNPQSD
ncbi:MAG: helix-turn-helix domain-containing protein [Bdellovibrionaceae bacterium]|nr:helix-turn-helix domain-containing protein [Pseudobdellovibrionaceae bacterium]